MTPSYARRVDASQSDVVDALQRIGFEVRDLSRQGGGCPDKLVCHPANGRMYLCEIKSPGTHYGRRLNTRQAKWAEGWPAPVVVLRSAEDALAWGLQAKTQEARAS